MATKTKKAVVKKVAKKAPAPVKATPAKKTPLKAAVAAGPKPKPCPPVKPCPEPPDSPAVTVEELFAGLEAPVGDTDIPASEYVDANTVGGHWTKTPLADIVEFGATVQRFDIVRGYMKRLDDIKERLSGDIKTWMGLAGLDKTVAMGMNIASVTSERKTFDRDRAVTVAHLTEEQIEQSMKTSKVTQLRIAPLKVNTDATEVQG